VVPAVGLAMAVRLSCEARAAGVYDRVAELRDRFEASLAALEPIEFIAADARRLPHVSNVAFLGVDRQALYMALDLAGIACSTGSACSSGSSRPSPILTAMGLGDETVASSLRFSWSRFSTSDELDRAIRVVTEVVSNLRSRATIPRAAKSISGALR
jgi:cysteine desulfurase